MKKIVVILASICMLNMSFAQENDKIIDGIIGIVGDKVILHSEVENQLLQAKQENVNLGANPRCLVYEELLFQSLLMYQAESVDSLEVSDDQVNGELNNRIRYFEAQIGGRKKLEEYYGKTIDEIKAEFFTSIKNRLLADRMRAKIAGSVSITPSDVKKYYNNLNPDSIPLVESKVEVAHITIKPEISDEVKKETKAKLNKYREEILSGESSFSSIAVFYSEDPGSRGKGGEFEWVTRGTFVPEFDRVAFKMKIGEVSEVFETDYGFHILELFDRRGDEYRGRHILLMPKLSEVDLANSKLKLDSIKKLIDDGVYTFEQAALKFSDDKESKNNGGLIYNKQSASSLFEMSQLDKQIFIIIDDLKEGEYSKPILSNSRDGSFYQICKLVSISKPHKANLQDDYQLIFQYASSNEKAKAIKEWIKEKSKSTYIKINPDYQNCEFVKEWTN